MPEAPGFTVSLNATQATPFRIDAAAFGRWSEAKREELECEIPTRADPRAGEMLAALLNDARNAGVIVGANAIELNVHGDDDEEASGFYVVLNNTSGNQRLIGLTSGWTEVLRIEEVIDAAACAREHLDEVCRVANNVLEALETTPPQRIDTAHRHFGYWINRAAGTARCYRCQYQFIGTDETAEDWNPA
ncbi:hypothetical protein [Mycolicibacterium fortuitum]|uniref:Uncharacterized protein n=2 Tax=Mycolicibacterium fortuitum TaxID=1766 RepID=A0AAE4VJK4_MYCFO|nr:hypothetical protein [Mycolicibacterium fortuitum]MCV7137578.1 hypothetical protein [Mycolicibacterium fortuitum]MDV7195646.1 hypothetical protein [Mycolicibacterium fortuitum]MDV7209321.1 hypothetical protein [Mycolicibacterium fortuitum]MDV7231159.1 hypothetical protein [Mycolicibacterium fortuitum]MDV7262756.1 hypothetical protein [Mycolicibacterium fortuitum]